MRLHESLKQMVAHVSQKELANELGVATSTVSQWLKGIEPCGSHHLAKIVQRYGSPDSQGKKSELARLFLLLSRERLRKDRSGWTDETWDLMTQCLDECTATLAAKSPRVNKSSGRTLEHFPDSFYPLVVVSGDKREVSETRINAGDFGVVSASPAESRWILKLSLRDDVQLLGDKIFILASTEELKDRFGKTNILVLGSPASNHLSRRLLVSNPPPGWRTSVPIFRFNLDQQIVGNIDALIRRLATLNARQLVGQQGDPDTERQVKNWRHDLFAGGILDPSYHDLWLRGREMGLNTDFGLLSLARNPFAENDEYVCILAAGFHMFGTAHAIRMLSKPEPEAFKGHPLGGVIRVRMDLHQPFHTRFDNSKADWDANSRYDQDRVVKGLNTLRDNIPTRTNITVEEIEGCLQFIEAL